MKYIPLKKFYAVSLREMAEISLIYRDNSIILFENPHSLSYQARILV
jgi:hypothetical protein